MTTVVVALNCNHSLIKEYHKGNKKYGIQEENITQTVQKLESLSALVLILTEGDFLSIRFVKKQPLSSLQNMHLYKKDLNPMYWNSHNSKTSNITIYKI